MRNTLKSALAVLAAACALAAPAAAQGDGPRFEPGPVVQLGASSVALARILLDKQLKDCVADWQAQADSIQSVTSQGLRPGVTQYVVSGLKLLGGDVVVGNVAMTIVETFTPAPFGFGQVPVYTCQVAASDVGGGSVDSGNDGACTIEKAQKVAEDAAIADFQAVTRDTRDTRAPRILGSTFLRTLESFPSQSEFSIRLTYPGLIGQSSYTVTVRDDDCSIVDLSAEHLE